MSDARSARFALMLAALVAAAPCGLAAQAADAREAALVRRIHELEPTSRAAAESAERAEAAAAVAARAALAPQGSVQVGPLRIVTTADQVAEAERLWNEEWSAFEPILGSRRGALDRMVFIYHRKPQAYPFDPGADHAISTVEFRRPVTDDRVRAAIRSAIGNAAGLALPDDIASWSGAGALGSVVVPARLYDRFAKSPSALAQGCLSGSIGSCWTAMGQLDPALDPVAAWYPPDEQRALVAQMQGRSSTLSRECLDGADVSCREFLMHVGYNAMVPYHQTIRANLLWFALERGGAGSLDRLVASVESEERPTGFAGSRLGAATNIRKHLAAASGMDPDVLMEQWRQGVMAGKPGAPTPEKRSRASTTLWITLFAALATRSKRWRLG